MLKNLGWIAILWVFVGCVEAPGDSFDERAQAAQPEDDGTGEPEAEVQCGADGVCETWCGGFDPDCPVFANPCEADGVCSPLCDFVDPDCDPQACERIVTDPFGAPWVPTRQVATPCGGTVTVRYDPRDPLVEARAFVEGKWPTFRAAIDLGYDEDGDGKNERSETEWRRGHNNANLDGFGASLTRGQGWPAWNDVHATEDPLEPSILAFEVTNGPDDEWDVIGAEYHYDYDPCNVPCLRGVPEREFLIHEAGWHRLGDGGFDCIQQKWVDKKGGSYILSVFDQCTEIAKNDFHRGRSAGGGANKHERVWTLHTFYEPGTNGVTLAKFDPWCREHDDANDPPVIGVDCPQTDAFYYPTQTCECDGEEGGSGGDHGH